MRRFLAAAFAALFLVAVTVPACAAATTSSKTGAVKAKSGTTKKK